jgi:Spy/CpxP family protein refolding chaperone
MFHYFFYFLPLIFNPRFLAYYTIIIFIRNLLLLRCDFINKGVGKNILNFELRRMVVKNKMMVYVVVALILFIGSPVWAGHGDCDMMMGGHPMGKGFGPMGKLKDLNLTAEQQAKVDGIMDQHKEEIRAMDEKIDAARKTLHETIHNEVFDEQKIREASKSLAKNKEDMDVLRGRMFSEIRTVLTPEQAAQLKEMKMVHQEQRKCREECRKMGKMEE